MIGDRDDPRSREEKFRLFFDSVGEGIFVCDVETGTFTDVNSVGCTMFGWSHDELMGLTIGSLSTEVPPYTQREAVKWLVRARSEGPQTFEWRCKTKSGRSFWAEVSLRCVAFDGRDVGLAIVRDITSRKRQQDEIALQAHRDALTGLPNRRDFDKKLTHEIARCDRYGTPLCLAIGDIDHFKAINDSCGHQVGDAALKRIADLLRRRLRRSDYVARWGGEEFIILLPETRLDAARELLNRLRTGIARCVFPEIGHPVTLSFGVTAYETSADSPDDLMKRVDSALYQSKRNGRNNVTQIASERIAR
jgi:diguanylate cyclase (GGDEF)-like protein/PAS domain S-box-containing protein